MKNAQKKNMKKSIDDDVIFLYETKFDLYSKLFI